MTPRLLGVLFALSLVGCAHAPMPPRPVAVVPSGSPVDPGAAANAARRIFDGRFVDDWLGLEVVIPEGFEPRIDFDDALVSIRGERAMGAVMMVPTAFDRGSAERFFASTLEAVVDNVGPLLSDGDTRPVELEWASGFERVWHNPGVTFTAVVGPVCGGRLGLAIILLEREADGELTRQRWTHAVAQLARAPACRAVFTTSDSRR